MAHCEHLEVRRLLSAVGGLDAFTVDFGVVNGRHRAAFASAPDGTRFLFSISGNGTGQAVADGDGFSLVVSGTDSRSSLNVFTDNFGLITGLSVDGSLRALNAR
ncbi:MAG TPA: hypothetical protein VIM11_02505, partial [Tepidisphaeraceae bacterium]